jgi:hypothetical protein
MSTLQKVNVLTLWDPGSGDVITTSLLAAGGIHHFIPRTVGTDSDLSANAATIPTTAWMKIELKGADACYIQIGTKIATVTGGAAVTDCGLQSQIVVSVCKHMVSMMLVRLPTMSPSPLKQPLL